MTEVDRSRTTASKQKLFDAALRLLGRNGPDGVTVARIASEAGVAKGTVYYNFGSKDALVASLLRHGVDLLAGRLRGAAARPDPDEALDGLVDAALAFVAEYAAFAQLLVSELWRTAGRWHETLRPLREDLVSVMTETLRRNASAGRLPEDVDMHTASAALFGTLLVVALDWRVFHPDRDRSEVRDSVLALLRGLRAQPGVHGYGSPT